MPRYLVMFQSNWFKVMPTCRHWSITDMIDQSLSGSRMTPYLLKLLWKGIPLGWDCSFREANLQNEVALAAIFNITGPRYNNQLSKGTIRRSPWLLLEVMISYCQLLWLSPALTAKWSKVLYITINKAEIIYPPPHTHTNTEIKTSSDKPSMIRRLESQYSK